MEASKGMKIRLNQCLLTIYLVFITISSVYLYVTRNKLKLCIIIAGLVIGYYIVSGLIIKGINLIASAKGANHGTRGCVGVFAVSTAITLMIFMTCFAAAYPGTFETDCITQLKQTVSGVYDDWHPIWHTLVCFTLPYKLTGQAASIVVFQILYLSAAIGFMTMVIYKGAGLTACIISYLYIVLNPFTLYISVSPLKDVGFGAACLVAMTLAADMYFDRDTVKPAVWKCILLGFMMANASIFRHNGLLFSVFLIFALFFHIIRSRWIVTACVFALSYFVIQGPVCSLVHAQHSETAVIQVVGLPMCIIGNTAVDTPDLMDEETEEFVYSIAPKEVWEDRFVRGNFNRMKYGGLHNPDAIEEKGVLPIVKMALRCAAASPQASLESFFALTDFVYGFDVRNKADIDVIVLGEADNDLGITYQGNDTIAHIMELYHKTAMVKGYNFILKLGFSVLIVISVILAVCRLNSWTDWKRIFSAFPILAYDFGTMLLLSGHDARFFFMSFLICPLTVIMLLDNRENMV